MTWTKVWRKLRWNVINEVDNVTREELMSSDYVMICCKPITEQGECYCTHKFCQTNMLQVDVKIPNKYTKWALIKSPSIFAVVV